MLGVVLNESLIRSLNDCGYQIETVGVKERVEEKNSVKDGGLYRISGTTYPVKEILKAIGCRWNSMDKCWYTTHKEWKERALERAGEDEKARKRINKLTCEEKDSKKTTVIERMVQKWKNS